MLNILARQYFTEPGKRVFDIDVEGTALSDVDIVQLGGDLARKAMTLDVSTTVSDGFLNINFLNNNPKIDQPSKFVNSAWNELSLPLFMLTNHFS